MRTCESCIWSVTAEDGSMFCEHHGIYIREEDEACVHYGPFNLDEYYVEADE